MTKDFPIVDAPVSCKYPFRIVISRSLRSFHELGRLLYYH